MERLTTHDPNRRILLISANATQWNEIYDRLAAYEDTGLEPEEVKEITSWSYGPFHKKMGDWLKAEQEGRLVMLPCKVGDTVYDIQDGHVLVLTVESIHIWSSGAIRISAHTDKTSMYWKSFELRPEGFGKVFFLTRADAEAALKGVSEDA